MATKGSSNRYGTPRGPYGKNNPNGVNYAWAKGFNKATLQKHFDKHGKELGFSSQESYKQHAIRFANTVDTKNYRAFVDFQGTTYKFNNKTGELAIVNKNGIIITYYKVAKDFKYIDKKGESVCVKKK